MNKKVISLVVLVPFITATVSCSYTTKERVVHPSVWIGTRPTIVGVVTKTGQSYTFTADRPARIEGKYVMGRETNRGVVEIDFSDIQDFAPAKGQIRQIQTADGQTYDVIRRNGDTFVCISTDELVIPLSEVDYLSIRKGSSAGPVIAAVIVVGALIILLSGAGREEEPEPAPSGGGSSCPFVYSFDGEQYVFDAEPFGGAVCRALQRTDWCGLDYLTEMNGTCTMMVTNELEETQYTDELGLLVVDHPQELSVFPDRWGQIHTVGRLAGPVRAVDEMGSDIASLVSENDWLFWTGTANAAAVAQKPMPRHELLFEFEKPKNATQAKLVLNGRNSVWGSASLAHFLELHGRGLGAWYDAMNERGALFFRTVAMHLREELFSLQLRVETELGWVTKDLVIGGGPFAEDDKVYCIDISDVPGETLRIKLTPPPYFWMINYLGVDYSTDLTVTTTELFPMKATDSNGHDVSVLLAERDDHYHVMESTDQAVHVVFNVPKKPDKMNRSFILKATGYYDIHVKADGEPDEHLLSKIEQEPGFAVRYAARQIQRWHKEALNTLASR